MLFVGLTDRRHDEVGFRVLSEHAIFFPDDMEALGLVESKGGGVMTVEVELYADGVVYVSADVVEGIVHESASDVATVVRRTDVQFMEDPQTIVYGLHGDVARQFFLAAVIKQQQEDLFSLYAVTDGLGVVESPQYLQAHTHVEQARKRGVEHHFGEGGDERGVALCGMAEVRHGESCRRDVSHDAGIVLCCVWPCRRLRHDVGSGGSS